MKIALEMVYEVSKLPKKSPKHDAAFEKLKADLTPETPGFCVLRPKRWTVCGLSLQTVIDYYVVILHVWEEALDGSLDSEKRARIISVQAQMQKFEFYLVFILELLYSAIQPISVVHFNTRIRLLLKVSA